MAGRKDKELDHQFRMRVVQVVSLGWQQTMRALIVLAVCLCVYCSIRQLSGRHTFADIRFRAIADLKANRYFGLILPWGVCGVATVWGAGERWLRKRHIKRVSSEGSEIQRKIDPGRRSSNLTKKGESSPEDF